MTDSTHPSNQDKPKKPLKGQWIVDSWQERLEEALDEQGMRRKPSRDEIFSDSMSFLAACGLARRTTPTLLGDAFRVLVNRACDRLDASKVQDVAEWRMQIYTAAESLASAWLQAPFDSRARFAGRTERILALLERTDDLMLATIELTNRELDWDATALEDGMPQFERWRAYMPAGWAAMRAETMGKARSWFAERRSTLGANAVRLSRQRAQDPTNAELALALATQWILTGEARVANARDETRMQREDALAVKRTLRLVYGESYELVETGDGWMSLSECLRQSRGRLEPTLKVDDPAALTLHFLAHHSHPSRAAASEQSNTASQRLHWAQQGTHNSATWVVAPSHGTDEVKLQFYERGEPSASFDGQPVEWLGASTNISNGIATFQTSTLSEGVSLEDFATEVNQLIVANTQWSLIRVTHKQ